MTVELSLLSIDKISIKYNLSIISFAGVFGIIAISYRPRDSHPIHRKSHHCSTSMLVLSPLGFKLSWRTHSQPYYIVHGW